MNISPRSISIIDKITDCIPIFSTIKNLIILFYQAIYKKDSLISDRNSSAPKEIHIYIVSKSKFFAGLATIPLLGNIGCLVMYAQKAIHAQKNEKNEKNKTEIPLDPLTLNPVDPLTSHKDNNVEPTSTIQDCKDNRENDRKTALSQNMGIAALLANDALRNSKLYPIDLSAHKRIVQSCYSETPKVRIDLTQPNLTEKELAPLLFQTLREQHFELSTTIFDYSQNWSPQMFKELPQEVCLSDLPASFLMHSKKKKFKLDHAEALYRKLSDIPFDFIEGTYTKILSTKYPKLPLNEGIGHAVLTRMTRTTGALIYFHLYHLLDNFKLPHQRHFALNDALIDAQRSFA